MSSAHALCQKGQADRLESLLEKNADAANEVNKQGQTPLMVACDAGEDECVSVLLKAGAKETLNNRDRANLSALQYACMNGSQSIASQLVAAGADVSVVDKNGFDIVHLAVRQKMGEFLRVLSKKKAKSEGEAGAGSALNFESLEPVNKQTPFLVAAQALDRETVEVLIALKCNTAAQDDEGNNALHYSVEGADLELTEYLCAKDSTLCNLQNHLGQTPLHTAYEKYRGNAGGFVKIMRKFGVDETIRDKRGLTPAEAANAPAADEEELKQKKEADDKARAEKIARKKAEKLSVDDETAAWLEENKLSELSEIFGRKNITVEDVAEFNATKLKRLNIPRQYHEALLAAAEKMQQDRAKEEGDVDQMDEESKQAELEKQKKIRYAIFVFLLVFFVALYYLFDVVVEKKKNARPFVNYDA